MCPVSLSLSSSVWGLTPLSLPMERQTTGAQREEQQRMIGCASKACRAAKMSAAVCAKAWVSIRGSAPVSLSTMPAAMHSISSGGHRPKFVDLHRDVGPHAIECLWRVAVDRGAPPQQRRCRVAQADQRAAPADQRASKARHALSDQQHGSSQSARVVDGQRAQWPLERW